MESFWTDTPFGISLLASLTLTMSTSVLVVVRNFIRIRAGAQPIDTSAGPKLAACLLGYALGMVVVTYFAMVLFYIAGGTLDLIESHYAVSFNQWVWQLLRGSVVCMWLSAAFPTCRRMFRRWL